MDMVNYANLPHHKHHESAMEKVMLLRRIFDSVEIDFLMGAHDSLSAKIAEKAGFKGVWISGLGLSAVHGLRDANELSWTQVVDEAQLIADGIEVPALLDADTGFGDFNNVRLVVRRMARLGIAGACIEDKLFPKTNSFIGEGQQLASIAEFCGKIAAARDTVASSLFLVARCEALVVGRGIAEAIDRCSSYVAAGADAILIHSKQETAEDILQFMREWRNQSPVVIIPTKYYRIPTASFEEAGVSVVIWANQSLRASIKAMQSFCADIYRSRNLVEIESTIAPLDAVFDLVDNQELELAKQRYLPEVRTPTAPDSSARSRRHGPRAQKTGYAP